ncbi:CTP pyrophosphohydrolase [Sinobacterium norvegicum]|uniref:8-oxo-dGTP diphosphatase n=1 Tax=Sinobacterium norvegicum TaxID=1641715 RepID=A0ABN8EN46_9GAMM|nr:CTP pyrophosphohydrolase [Sinobacterium norvegicum]
MTEKKVVAVAVGVIMHADGEHCLLAIRPAGKHLAGFWEFPGGKVDGDESVEQALCRELREELGLQVTSSSALLVQHFDYPEKSVALHTRVVTDFDSGITLMLGEDGQGSEGQLIRWVALADLAEYQLPEANAPIVDALLAKYNR